MPDKRPLLASLDAVCLSAPRASARVARPCLNLRRRFIEKDLSFCLDQVMLSQRDRDLTALRVWLRQWCPCMLMLFAPVIVDLPRPLVSDVRHVHFTPPFHHVGRP